MQQPDPNSVWIVAGALLIITAAVIVVLSQILGVLVSIKQLREKQPEEEGKPATRAELAALRKDVDSFKAMYLANRQTDSDQLAALRKSIETLSSTTEALGRTIHNDLAKSLRWIGRHVQAVIGKEMPPVGLMDDDKEDS
jgi:biopolymer transport protein ExbB/TolQ